MNNYRNVYEDIAIRTDGNIYIGFVGPARTGKSTIIQKIMNIFIIPNIENDLARARAIDELPQSSGGKTIMTTEPKFIPNEAVEIFLGKNTSDENKTLGENISFKARLIDCVGYVVNNSLGSVENGAPRMVITPWSTEPMPFSQAAEIGTKKVITEHSTIGIVVTTDGTITDIDREDYIDAEDKVINELKELNKPFIVVLNTIDPNSESAKNAKKQIEEKHNISVININCKELEAEDISNIMETVLFEFPLTEISINIPKWVNNLDDKHWLKASIKENILKSVKNISKIKEIKSITEQLEEFENTEKVLIKQINLGEGNATIDIKTLETLFYKIIEETSGFLINGQEEIINFMSELSLIKKKYDKISGALDEVSRKGYGIVSPTIDELTLEEPEIVKQGNKFGVKLKASAPSIHMIRADIETEVSPIVGTEKQSEELVHYLLKEFEVDPKKIWESNIFGKSLHELVNEGLHNKLYKMPEDAQFKLQETLQKIINEGSGGLICIIL
ncbi:MAG: stage IV sporulation protein A [Clostridiales bacterium]|nr:stage IV sporulation protein A [Clostridiales bacterium]